MSLEGVVADRRGNVALSRSVSSTFRNNMTKRSSAQSMEQPNVKKLCSLGCVGESDAELRSHEQFSRKFSLAGGSPHPSYLTDNKKISYTNTGTPKYESVDAVQGSKLAVAPLSILEFSSSLAPHFLLGLDVLKLYSLSAPSTPKLEEVSNFKCYPSSRFEAMPPPALVNLIRRISAADLCRLSLMNRFCYKLFEKDEYWQLKSEQEGFSKAKADENWKFNYKTAMEGAVHARSLDKSSLVFRGDLTVVDPFKIFFLGQGNEVRKAQLMQLLYRHRHEDVIVTYRGIDTAFIRSCRDDDTAFEVSRKGKCVVGEDSAESCIIAAVPQKLVQILMEENQSHEKVGVFVENVHGELRSSLDGDFLIRSIDSESNPLWPCDRDEIEDAEVVCVSGGSWTYSDDSDDEDYELTEEDLARSCDHEDTTMSWFEYEERYKRGRQVC